MLSGIPSSPLLNRAVTAAFGDDLAERVATACREYFIADGRRSFDQCLGLPQSAGRRRNLIRNQWLLIACTELRATDDDATPAALHALLMRFIERGSWQRWREAGGPPVDAADLHVALWHIVKANKGRGLSCKHLEALLKNSPRNFHVPALPFDRALSCSAKP